MNQEIEHLTAQISCPLCSQALRIPQGKNLKVTCPKCRESWNQTTQIGIAFKCAVTGEAFGVLLEKSNKYQIRQIDKASEGRGDFKPVTVNADEIDWLGFYCPCCGIEGESLFIRCGSCKNLVCGGTTRKVEFGTEFKCCCGKFSLMKEGASSISSYEAAQGDSTSKLDSPAPILLN